MKRSPLLLVSAGMMLLAGIFVQPGAAALAWPPASPALSSASSAAEGDGGGTGVLTYCYQPLTGDWSHQIYTIRVNGTENTKILESDVGMNHQSWSPDGRKLAAVGYVTSLTWSIYSFNADGTGLTRLTNTLGVQDNDPGWSPDGERIVFARIYPSQSMRKELWIMDSDGGNKHWIGIEGFDASWSPDGTRFVYQKGEFGNTRLYFCDVDGTNEEQIVIWPLSACQENASWSPDGTKIAFSTTRDGNPEIYTVNIDGSDPVRLTDTPWDEYGAQWSPDGSMIAFSSGILYDLVNPVEIHVMDADGSNWRRITYSPPNVTGINPGWQPVDSTTVATFLSDFLWEWIDGAVSLTWRTAVDAAEDEFRLEAESTGITRDIPVEKTGRATFHAIDSGPGLDSDGETIYRLYSLADDGDWTVIRTERIDHASPPAGSMILNAWPNPFNPNTTITFRLDGPANVRIAVFDPGGRMIRVLKDTLYAGGGHSVAWNGLDSEGRAVPSGCYFLRLTADKRTETRKLVLMR